MARRKTTARPEAPARRNPVAHHATSVNRCVIMSDRKKADKRGYRKHRGETPDVHWAA